MNILSIREKNPGQEQKKYLHFLTFLSNNYTLRMRDQGLCARKARLEAYALYLSMLTLAAIAQTNLKLPSQKICVEQTCS